MIIQFCGLSGAGKTTLGKLVCSNLEQAGIETELIDGDEYRSNLSRELGFSASDRKENMRRLGFIAARMATHNIIPVISAINPYEETRAELANNYPDVKTIFIDCPLNLLMQRDTKGLYRRALLPRHDPLYLNNLSGINDTFEIPANPDLYINTSEKAIETCAGEITTFILEQLQCNATK